MAVPTRAGPANLRGVSSALPTVEPGTPSEERLRLLVSWNAPEHAPTTRQDAPDRA